MQDSAGSGTRSADYAVVLECCPCSWGITSPTSSLRRYLCFLQFLEQSLDTKMGRCEFVDEYILRGCPLRGATQQLVDSLDLPN